MITEYFKLGVKNLRRRGLRSWLTMVGIFIAIATIFVLISISLGLQSAVQEQFRQLGTDKIIIMPKGSAGQPGSTSAVTMTTDDADVVEKVAGVKAASYASLKNGKDEFNNEVIYSPYIIGIPLDKSEVFQVMFESMNIKADEGRLFSRGDSGVIMIGNNYKTEKVFSKPVSAGDTMTINGQDFRVKAIISKIGNPQDDVQIYMPFGDFKVLFNTTNKIDEIIVQVTPGANVDDVAFRIEKKLRSFRDVTEKTQDFTILTPAELLRSFNTILNILTAFLLGIASISLLVGAVGIATTMYTAVLERYREIGVMKAVGARNSDILQIFVIESGLLGLVGGLIGIALGAGAAKLIEYIVVNQFDTTLLKVVFPWYLIVGCLTFAFVIGVISGAFPAWQASKIKPVEALRYE